MFVLGEYFIVQQILAKGLHTSDNESQAYTIGLMDKLERTKSELGSNDAVSDDVAAQAYVEQFALETFQRGDNAIRANTVGPYATPPSSSAENL